MVKCVSKGKEMRNQLSFSATLAHSPSDLISRCGFACRCALTESHSLTWLSSFKEKERVVDRQGSRLINTLSVAAERSLGLKKKKIKSSYSLLLLTASEHWVSIWSCIASFPEFSHSQLENQSSFLFFLLFEICSCFLGPHITVITLFGQ